jgi:hypothetical protein
MRCTTHAHLEAYWQRISQLGSLFGGHCTGVFPDVFNGVLTRAYRYLHTCSVCTFHSWLLWCADHEGLMLSAGEGICSRQGMRAICMREEAYVVRAPSFGMPAAGCWSLRCSAGTSPKTSGRACSSDLTALRDAPPILDRIEICTLTSVPARHAILLNCFPAQFSASAPLLALYTAQECAAPLFDFRNTLRARSPSDLHTTRWPLLPATSVPPVPSATGASCSRASVLWVKQNETQP